MIIANALFGSKGPTKYDVVEIKETNEGRWLFVFVTNQGNSRSARSA